MSFFLLGAIGRSVSLAGASPSISTATAPLLHYLTSSVTPVSAAGFIVARARTALTMFVLWGAVYSLCIGEPLRGGGGFGNAAASAATVSCVRYAANPLCLSGGGT